VLEKNLFVKHLEFWAMVVQETICWLNPGCALLCCCRSRIHSEAGKISSYSTMTHHYPTTSAAAAAWASGPSVPVSAMLLIYTYSLLPARALSKALLFLLGLHFNC